MLFPGTLLLFLPLKNKQKTNQTKNPNQSKRNKNPTLRAFHLQFHGERHWTSLSPKMLIYPSNITGNLRWGTWDVISFSKGVFLKQKHHPNNISECYYQFYENPLIYLIRDCSFKGISSMLLSLLNYVLLRPFFYFYSSSDIQHIYWWYFLISLRSIWAMKFSSYYQPFTGTRRWLYSKKAHCGNYIVLMTFWSVHPT